LGVSTTGAGDVPRRAVAADARHEGGHAGVVPCARCHGRSGI